jgi:APA family basic amino acid/polyamine antiporter
MTEPAAPAVAVPKTAGNLLRILGVSFGIAVTVGGTIGVGILRTPGMVAAELRHPWLILGVWVLGGVYALFGTLAVAELGTLLPRAGGWYVYARRAFGEYPGFAVGWSDWIAQCAALAYLATAMAEFSGTLLPAFSGATKALAISSLLAFALLQWRGLRLSGWAQELTSLVKAVAFLALVGACFLLGGAGRPAGDAAPPGGGWGLLVALVIALQSVIITYDGWYSAIYFTEEDRDPARNLPRSALGGIAATIVIYLLVNLALLHVLPVDRLAASQLPAATAAQQLFGGYGGPTVTALSIVSLPSVIHAVLLLAARILFAMSRDGWFAAKAAGVNLRGTPSVATFSTALVGVVLIATGTFETLIAIAAFLYGAIYGSGFLSLFVLRRREPDRVRPFRAWGYPWTTLVVLVGSALFLVGNLLSDPRNSLYALALMGLSYPAFRLGTRPPVHPKGEPAEEASRPHERESEGEIDR